MAAGQFVHAVRALAGIEHVGDQHRVVEGPDLDAVAGEHQPVVLDVLADLEHRRILQERLQARLHGLPGELPRQQAAAEQVLAAAMAERDVAGPARRGGERDADEIGLVGVERGRLGIDRDDARLDRLGDPGFQALDGGDGLVGGGVERLDRFRGARRHQGGGRGLGRRLRLWRPIRQGEIGEGIDLGLGVGRRAIGRVAEERRDVAAALLVREAGIGPLRQEGGIGPHGLGVDMQHLGDAARQGVELHRLQEADEALGIGLRQAQIVEGHRHRHLLVEGDEAARQAGLVDMGEQRLAALGLLDRAGLLQERVEAAELLDEGRRGLEPDARHARHVVRGVADQRQGVADLLRIQALPALDDRGAVEVALRPVARLALLARFEVVEPHQIADELHQVLVGRDDDDARSPRLGLAGIGRDQVVGLVALQLDRMQAEGADRIAHQRHLALEVVGRVGPVALVVRKDLLAERALGLVEHDGEMGRHHPGRALLHELGELGAEQPHRPGRQTVGGPEIVAFGLVDRLEIGPEDERRAVDQEHLIAGADGLRLGAVSVLMRADIFSAGV